MSAAVRRPKPGVAYRVDCPEEPGQHAPELEAALRAYLDHPAYRAHLARTTTRKAH